jgi:hypothetical protein
VSWPRSGRRARAQAAAILARAGLGGREQRLPLAGPFGFQERVHAGHQPLAGEVRGGDLGQVLDIEQVPGSDLPRAGRDQRRPAVLAEPAPSRRGQVRYQDRDHPRLPKQRQADIAGRIRGDIRRHGRTERHAEAPGRKG